MLTVTATRAWIELLERALYDVPDDPDTFRRHHLNTWCHDTQEPPASVPLEQPSERRIHAADSGGGPASPLGTSGPAACQAPGSLGRHPVPAGAPASCPCGRVRRYPPTSTKEPSP